MGTNGQLTTTSALTVGNVTVPLTGNRANYNWYGQYFYQWHYPVEPTHCIGKAHVFECDHVKTCKCGAVERVMGKATKKGKR